jgi:lipoprotein-releasing system permease protein
VGVPFYIARRYLISRKSTNVINIISGISVFGILFCTAALIVLLSAFNGLESWVIRLYNTFDPALKVSLVHGKFFEEDQSKIGQLREIKGVKQIVETVEENGLITYRDAQYICTIKGVDARFTQTTELGQKMSAGIFLLEQGGQSFALVGSGVAYALSVSLSDIHRPLELHVPRPGIVRSLNPAEAFHSAQIFPSGIFEVQPEYDSKYLIVPLEFARTLFLRDKQLSALEITLEEGADLDKVREDATRILGKKFLVRDRFQQHEVLYKIINSEKWAVFLIGIFILLIAAFNITGSLTMLIVDKTRDIKTLRSLGLPSRRIRKIFFLEGLLISLIGMAGGLLLGAALVWIQQQSGYVMINLYDAYPVQFQLNDFILVGFTVAGIGAVASWFPSAGIFRKQSAREW